MRGREIWIDGWMDGCKSRAFLALGCIACWRLDSLRVVCSRSARDCGGKSSADKGSRVSVQRENNWAFELNGTEWN